MQIIPAIDIIDGKGVRLTQGDYDRKTVYNNDPLELALRFEAAGLRRLHLVDLDGARSGMVKNWKVLERIATKTGLVIDFSGGISDQHNLDITFNSGAAYAAVGSLAVKDEFTLAGWLLAYGADKFIIGADVRNEKIVVRGWTETSSITVIELIKTYHEKKVTQFFCTDVERDGMLEGSSNQLYQKILEHHPSIHLIASGGVSSMKDVEELQNIGCTGVIIGKAIYENRIRLSDLTQYVIRNKC